MCKYHQLFFLKKVNDCESIMIKYAILFKRCNFFHMAAILFVAMEMEGSGIKLFNRCFTQKNPLYSLGITKFSNYASKTNAIQLPYLPLKQYIYRNKTA